MAATYAVGNPGSEPASLTSLPKRLPLGGGEPWSVESTKKTSYYLNELCHPCQAGPFGPATFSVAVFTSFARRELGDVATGSRGTKLRGSRAGVEPQRGHATTIPPRAQLVQGHGSPTAAALRWPCVSSAWPRPSLSSSQVPFVVCFGVLARDSLYQARRSLHGFRVYLLLLLFIQ